MSVIELSKEDARRALVAYHLRTGSLPEVFDRLRSIQFDPLKPVGSNHDLVLQARVKGYRVGDWERAAYKDRYIYDGWDKQASLVPFSGWPIRRIFHKWNGTWLDEHRAEFAHAVATVLAELRDRGPLQPRDFEFQQQREEHVGSWYGTSLTKRVLLSLWHAGEVMTHSRRSGQHIYDLTERVLPAGLSETPILSEEDAIHALVRERHYAVGLLRPFAAYEVWSFRNVIGKQKAITRLLAEEEIVKVNVEGMLFHASPKLLEHLDRPEPTKKVTFIAPLDQLVWDRTAVRHIFDFDYLWEVYVPEAKRKWGYYVLPVLYGDRFVARVDLQVLKGVLIVKSWHWEGHAKPTAGFMSELEKAFTRFIKYCRAASVVALPGVDSKVGELLNSLNSPMH